MNIKIKFCVKKYINLLDMNPVTGHFTHTYVNVPLFWKHRIQTIFKIYSKINLRDSRKNIEICTKKINVEHFFNRESVT